MIVRSLCNSCFQTYLLVFQPSELDLVKQVADPQGHTSPCPRLCGGRINLVGEFQISEMSDKLRLREPIRLSGRELFQAVNGMGLPDEIPTSELILETLFYRRQVTNFSAEVIDGKIYLHEIEFNGGSEGEFPTKVHLASGQRGALVLKITQEPPHGA